MKTLIVVSGGDAPGINAAIWHYTRLAADEGDTVIGAAGGMPGLLNETLIPLTPQHLAPVAQLPGSYLASSRDPVLAAESAADNLRSIVKKHSIDNLVLFGGNGTLRYVMPLLVDWGLPCIGFPTTIDNDVAGTDYTLGFDSACNYAYHAIDGARATAHALPGRIFLIETLGGNSGMLALEVAKGAGADAILVPEYAYNEDWLADRLNTRIAANGHALIVICEGLPNKAALAEKIPQWTGIRLRDVRLGHAQRGGTPTHRDRAFAAELALKAHEALRAGCTLGTIIVREGVTRLFEGKLTGATPLPDPIAYTQINGSQSWYGNSGN